MGQYKINLLNHDVSDRGDVMTLDGEIIGTWRVDQDGFYMFYVPNEDELLILDPFIGLFCEKVWQWHSGQTPPVTS